MKTLRAWIAMGCGLVVVAGVAGVGAGAEGPGGITFHDVAAGDAAGIHYRRVPSATNVAYEALKHQPIYTMDDLMAVSYTHLTLPTILRV